MRRNPPALLISHSKKGSSTLLRHAFDWTWCNSAAFEDKRETSTSTHYFLFITLQQCGVRCSSCDPGTYIHIWFNILYSALKGQFKSSERARGDTHTKKGKSHLRNTNVTNVLKDTQTRISTRGEGKKSIQHVIAIYCFAILYRYTKSKFQSFLYIYFVYLNC